MPNTIAKTLVAELKKTLEELERSVGKLDGEFLAGRIPEDYKGIMDPRDDWVEYQRLMLQQQDELKTVFKPMFRQSSDINRIVGELAIYSFESANVIDSLGRQHWFDDVIKRAYGHRAEERFRDESKRR